MHLSMKRQMKKLKWNWHRIVSLRSRSVFGGLNEILNVANAGTDLHTRFLWLESLLHWLLRDDEPEKIAVRFRFFFQRVEQDDKLGNQARECLRSILRDASFERFFSETAFAPEHGLAGDIWERVLNRVFPMPNRGDFLEVINQVVPSESELPRLEAISDDVYEQAAKWLESGADSALWDKAMLDMQWAMRRTAISLAHHAFHPEIYRRRRPVGSRSLDEDPWIQMGEVLRARPILKDTFEQVLARCRSEWNDAYAAMEVSGVSVELVHLLEMLGAMLERLQLLVNLNANPALFVRGAFADLATASVQKRSIRAYFSQHYFLLSKKIAERNGHSGDHYIARSPDEKRHLFLSALGGGVVVVLMTVCKTLWLRLEPAPLFFAAGVWLIYSSGFLAMQFLGFTLATKLPSFTAFYLAKQIREAEKEGRGVEIFREFSTVAKSQAVALFGNLSAVIPLSLCVVWLVRTLGGVNVMTEHEAQHYWEGLHPWHSAALLLGGLTGVLLWLSSIAGGWFENWMVFRGVPETISHHARIRAVFGDVRAQSWGDAVLKHASGFGTNIALGFLFGVIPVVGGFLGLNLDAKHVTISTSAAVISVMRLWDSLGVAAVVQVVFCLMGIGLLNLGVSFWLALTIAARSRTKAGTGVWQRLRRLRE